MIHEVLQNIQTELKAPKGQYNSFGKYKYRSCEDILEALKPVLAKHKASVTLSDELVMVGQRYYIKATATLYVADESIAVTAYAREEEEKKGMDGSQITGTSSSYARKYALNGMFAIDDTKDSDTTNTGDKPVEDEPLTYETALEYELTFGKYSGKTLREIYKEDSGYVKFLYEGEKTNPKLREAIGLINEEIRKSREKRQGEES